VNGVVRYAALSADVGHVGEERLWTADEDRDIGGVVDELADDIRAGTPAVQMWSGGGLVSSQEDLEARIREPVGVGGEFVHVRHQLDTAVDMQKAHRPSAIRIRERSGDRQCWGDSDSCGQHNDGC